MQNVFLIDSSIYIFRFYFSGRPSVLSKEGREVSTVLAFARWLLQFLEKEMPTELGCFFDESLETCFRNEIDLNYKSNRTRPDEDLAYELLACKKVAELMGIPIYASDRFEADDLIAASARAVYANGKEPLLVTRDKDLGQLLKKDSGYFWDYGYDDPIAYDSFAREFGIQPKHIADFLAIAGDSADSIVGVKGIGKKTVEALFAHFDGWSELRGKINEVPTLKIRGAKGVAEKLSNSVELIEHNLKLTRLAYDSILPEALNFRKSNADNAALISLLGSFNASKSLIAKAEKC